MTNTLIVRKCTLSEVVDAPNFPELAAEYEAESATPGLPSPVPNIPLYRQLEDAGALTVFGAWLADTLIGFMGLLYHEVPRYNTRLAVCETYFVTQPHRRSGAGLTLRRLAEQTAEDLGAPGLLLSAPVLSDLHVILAASKKYQHFSNCYVMSFK